MTKRSHYDSSSDEDGSSNSTLTAKRPFFHRQKSVISRFESLRRQYSENDYYDPYQQEQVLQQSGKRKSMSDDDQQQRPNKRRKSFASLVKHGVIQGVLFGSALALSAYDYLQSTTPALKRTASLCSLEVLKTNINLQGRRTMDDWLTGSFSGHDMDKKKKSMRGHGVDFTYFHRSPTFEKRMQKTEQLIRSICLDQQYALNQQFTPTQEEGCWGIINKDDYDVHFTTMPPPKPKRTFTYLQKQKNLFNTT
ncbi:uncharacterized protein BX664DRAFT_335209 [Halteromyces radiatus]|uniref:uncharacterized protein n=1 Tax=Halteromyces radiatus TaxID=101107 RepID=UPI002220D81B|nr:uncharacterized protein BX664DRAFT_335209 [Halteromyces radiatus]KAI8086222.1 hypothetical protein BX664DRAFT_335209 [Halteromyces radiatus]